MEIVENFEIKEIELFDFTDIKNYLNIKLIWIK